MAQINVPKKSINFNVTRRPAELITPARSTPYERKQLSDIDDSVQLRFQILTILTYKNRHGNDINKHCLHREVHPAKVFKDAIGKALVLYYPFAGRLRPAIGGRLVVECNEEGVVFIEADADVTLEDLGGDQFIYDPFCMTDLLHVVPGSNGIINSPLMLFQVTRLKCGGFIFAHSLNHLMADAFGVVQFLNAVAEFARGAESPSIKPVWERNLLTDQPLLEIYFDNDFQMHETNSRKNITQSNDMVTKYFFFGSAEIAAIRSSLPPSMKSFTKFDLIVAHLWRSRTIALYKDPNDVVQMKFIINIRSKINPPLPTGYYGNVIIAPVIETTADKLSNNPIQYAVELVTSPKFKINQNNMNSSVSDLTKTNATKMSDSMFIISDTTKVGFDRLDFGWGESVSVTVHEGIYKPRNFICFITPFKRGNENGVVASIHLPRPAMEKFVKIVTQFNTLSNL